MISLLSAAGNVGGVNNTSGVGKTIGPVTVSVADGDGGDIPVADETDTLSLKDDGVVSLTLI